MRTALHLYCQVVYQQIAPTYVSKMAGGGSSLTLIQTPSWTLAILFIIFLLISLVLEHVHRQPPRQQCADWTMPPHLGKPCPPLLSSFRCVGCLCRLRRTVCRVGGHACGRLPLVALQQVWQAVPDRSLTPRLRALTALPQGLHFLVHTFKKRNKPGLVAAVENLKTELLTLGFISLLLVAFGHTIESVCVNRANSWWLVQTTSGGCPECLYHTKGLDKCYLEYQQCPAYPPSSYGASSSYKDASSAGYADESHAADTAHAAANSSYGEAGAHRRLFAGASASEGLCYQGHAVTAQCRGDQEPLLTFITEEQVHILLFIMACMHIAVAVTLMVLAHLRIK